LAASKTLTKTQLTLRARVAANTWWSDPQARAELRAQHAEKRLQKFADEIDPDHKLPEDERTRLAVQRRRAHMQKLALKSSQERARKAAADAT
jgi:hypothetical protein